jgi:hypothetical protein
MRKLSISLTCCNRPDYLSQVLDALANADKTNIDARLNISIDKADPQVIEIAKSFKGLSIDNLIVHDPKLGCNQNTLYAIKLASSTDHSPYILHLEDDTVPTKDCLQFFMYAFHKYEADDTVLSIGGYNKTEDLDDDLIYSTFSEAFFSAWGCGFWKHKLDKIYQAWTTSNTNNGMSWDSYLSEYFFERQNHLQLRPQISRIQNIGAEKGTWVADPMWHYYNHRSPFLSNDYSGTIDWVKYAENNS